MIRRHQMSPAALCGLLLIISSSLAVAGQWTQSTCTDSGCSQNCVSKTFNEGDCYPTESSGTSARVWCQDDGSILKEQIWSESTSCSGFSYINKISAGICNQGSTGYYFEDICGSNSNSKNTSTTVINDGQQQQQLKVHFIVRPAPDAIGNMTREQKRLMEQGKIVVDFTYRGDRITLRHFPLPPFAKPSKSKYDPVPEDRKRRGERKSKQERGPRVLAEKKEKESHEDARRVKVRFAMVKPMATRRKPRFELARKEKGYYAGFGRAVPAPGVVTVTPNSGRMISIHKAPLLELLENSKWDRRRGAEVVFLDSERREVFMIWVQAL